MNIIEYEELKKMGQRGIKFSKTEFDRSKLIDNLELKLIKLLRIKKD